jgi:threonine/homoserine efflux transporter RhtA
MRRTTPAQLSTYGYVNPAIAAVTGWVLLGEALSYLQITGRAGNHFGRRHLCDVA